MKHSERVTVLLTPEELRRVDDWRFANRAPNRSEAIRQMIARVLDAADPPEPEPRRS